MFRWDLAKSAEAMLSRWAIKRLCKFLLKKKKLGDYIDLDQLDVQLAEGAIQLRDLALNVDFINHKLGETPVFVKEGTIVSLSIKIPWKMRNCQIEVEDLELVIAPCGDRSLPTGTDSFLLNGGEKESKGNAPEKVEQGVGPGSLASSSLDVHEGVKTIAKIVKWFLTSFNIKVRNFIVAFDPCSAGDDKGSPSHRNLVLRVAEIEYGTCVSEDATSRLSSLFGIAKLTNFIKFHGAVVEFLEMNDPCASETSISELYSKSSPSGSTFQVLSGEGGGFSGVLNLSIPWKNGSLDIHKVDADLSVDPVELWLEPRTMKWIIFSWESLKNVNNIRRSHVNTTNTDAVHQSYALGSIHLDTNRKASSNGFFSLGIDSEKQGSGSGDSPSPTYIIQNWVTSDNSLKGHAELEPDYGVSIDQFFECFDEMRSSHASLGNSGIWNWTCSVFSAITAASSLASESGYVPYEQQYIETKLKAKVSAVSIVLSFDDQTNCSQNLMGDYRQMEDLYGTAYDTFPNSLCQTVHYVETKCQDLALTLQICAKGTEVEVTISHIEVDHSLNVESEAERLFSKVSHLQAGVQGMLPPWPFLNSESDATSVSFSSTTQPCNESFREKSDTVTRGGLVKVQLMESFGACCCRYSVTSTSPSNKSTVLSSFSVYLPQFILWLDFSLVNTLVALFEQVSNSLKDVDIKDSASDVSKEKHGAFSHGDVCSGTCIQTIPPRGSLQGDIFFSHTRIILCFPFHNVGSMEELYSWNSCIGLEISPLPSSTDKACGTVKAPKRAYLKGHSHTPSTFVHFHNGPLDIYLITSSRKGGLSNDPYTDDLPNFVSKKVLSITGGTDNCHPLITMLWQRGPVTGPWMAKRAWSLATWQDPGNWRNVTGKGNEFVSVKKAEGLDEMSSQVRQEMILSSAFLIHICLPQVWIDLSSPEYRLLYHLLNDVQEGLSCLQRDNDATVFEGPKMKHPFETDSNVSQAAVLVECDLLDIRIALDEVMEISRSLQKELAGSWKSLKLTIRKFELLSVSSVGGLSSDSFLWLGHDEGDLWGSIVNMDASTSASTQDLLLITCRNSTMKRGDGEGGNILCSGSPGTSITHLSNQQLFQSFTSINIRCATIIAPGGRLDWFGAIFLYFSLASHEGAAENGRTVNEFSEGIATRRQLFSLDLVDVGLSYEPHQKSKGMSFEVPADCQSSAKPNDESSEQNVACLLAAASLNLFNQTMGHAADSDYNIRIQDIGLLICEQSGSRAEMEGYSVNYLQESGYVKVAKEALVDAILRTNCQNGLLWEVEFSDSHVNVGTCHDTTSGLVHLVAQLQQLFAPDVGDALVHLQSRWDSVKRTHDENDTISAAKVHDRSVGLDSYEESSGNDGNTAYTGLMDEILDNAFCWEAKQATQTDLCNTDSDILLHNGMPKVRYNVDISSPAAGDLSLPSVSFNGSILKSGSENIQVSTEPNTCLPQLIERYYMSELLPQSKASVNCSSNEACKNESTIGANRDVECVKGGWYEDSPFIIVEDHVSDGSDNTGRKQSHKENQFPFDTTLVETCTAKGRIILKNIDIRWRLYSGCDWAKTRKSSLSGSSSENGRDENVCLELTLSGFDLQYDFYPDGELFVSKLSLSIQDFYLHDMCRNAPWKMVLGYYHSKNHPRESSAKAVKLDLESVKPDPSTPLEEYRLQFAFLPMRLHLHQGQLNFLLSFFSNDSSVGLHSGPNNDLEGTQTSFMKNRSIGGQDIVEEALLPFFQKCDIFPAVVRVDYIPHHVDVAALRGGNYVQLINLVPWKGIDIQLKPVHAVGIYGWGSVCETVAGEWLEDISHNQVHKILKGLAPVRSVFAVSSGAAKLVSLPVKNYKKDHRLLKGIQRGAIAFLRSVSLEAVGLGVHLAGGAHDLLVQTEHILTRIPPSVPLSQDSLKASVRCNQPKNARHGIQQAYESLSDGFGKSASALVGTPLKTYQRGAGAGSAFASAIRAAPVAAVAPASAVARALHCTLLGVRNSLDPEHKKESMEKYLGSSRS